MTTSERRTQEVVGVAGLGRSSLQGGADTEHRSACGVTRGWVVCVRKLPSHLSGLPSRTEIRSPQLETSSLDGSPLGLGRRDDWECRIRPESGGARCKKLQRLCDFVVSDQLVVAGLCLFGIIAASQQLPEDLPRHSQRKGRERGRIEVDSIEGFVQKCFEDPGFVLFLDNGCPRPCSSVDHPVCGRDPPLP